MAAFALIFLFYVCFGQDISPTIRLYNAADPDLRMPVVGKGSCCKRNVTDYFDIGYQTAFQWFSVGGRRWDSAYDYATRDGVAAALMNITSNWSAVPRSEIFITSKIGGGSDGDGTRLGYNDTIQEWTELIELYNTTYVDLLLMHWPSPSVGQITNDSTDAFCNSGDSVNYNASLCRQSTWKAMEYIFNNKGVRAIGVSNFEIKHLDDIFALNSLIPAVNQFEFHGYWHEFELVQYCQNHNITVNSYCPLGAPDWKQGDWPIILPQHPTAIQIGQKYGKTGAQVWLRWQHQQNVIFNPRSENITHMKQNLNVFDFQLNQEDMLNLASVTPPSDNKICPDPMNNP